LEAHKWTSREELWAQAKYKVFKACTKTLDNTAWWALIGHRFLDTLQISGPPLIFFLSNLQQPLVKQEQREYAVRLSQYLAVFVLIIAGVDARLQPGKLADDALSASQVAMTSARYVQRKFSMTHVLNKPLVMQRIADYLALIERSAPLAWLGSSEDEADFKKLPSGREIAWPMSLVERLAEICQWAALANANQKVLDEIRYHYCLGKAIGQVMQVAFLVLQVVFSLLKASKESACKEVTSLNNSITSAICDPVSSLHIYASVCGTLAMVITFGIEFAKCEAKGVKRNQNEWSEYGLKLENHLCSETGVQSMPPDKLKEVADRMLDFIDRNKKYGLVNMNDPAVDVEKSALRELYHLPEEC